MKSKTENITPVKKPALYSWGSFVIPLLIMLVKYLCEFPNESDAVIVTSIGSFLFIIGPIVLFHIDRHQGRISNLNCTVLIICWILLVLFIIFFIVPQLLGARRSAWESRCKLTLRALGSSQLAYLDSNGSDFATWREFENAGYITEGYNQKNLIDNYSIIVFDVRKSSSLVNGSYKPDGLCNDDSSFQIVAIPRSERNRLRTFAINERQKPLVWIGEDNDWSTDNIDLDNSHHWSTKSKGKLFEIRFRKE